MLYYQLPTHRVHHFSNNVGRVAPQGKLKAEDMDPRVEDEDRVKLVADTLRILG